MAKKQAELIVKVKDNATKPLGAITKALNGLKKFTKQAATDIKNFGSSMKEAFSSRFVVTAGDVVNGLQAIGRAMINLARLTGQVQGVEAAFENLTRSQGRDAAEMLANMQDLSAGTVSNLELMRQANSAVLLGLPVERFGEMLSIAQSSARATGQSMDFMLNSIVTGLGRGSKLMLDNLGIIFKIEDANKNYAQTMGIVGRELSEAEKKQAFINEALRVGNLNAKAAGKGALTLSEMMDKITASSENVASSLGKRLSPALDFIVYGLSKTAEAIDKAFEPEKTGRNIAIIESEIKKVEATLASLAAQQKANPISFAFSGGTREINAQTAAYGELLAERTIVATKMAEIDAQEAARLETQRLAGQEAKDAQKVMDEEFLIAQQEAENALIGTDQAAKLDAAKKFLDDRIRLETDASKKLALFKAKGVIVEQQRALKEAEEKKKEDAKYIAARANVLATISGLQRSSNSTLAMIGKAAALTQIAIAAPQGIANALALGPIIGPPAALLMKVAFAAQAAQVAGVALAEGGIVKATPGGIQATIGEGGRDEAVIPLDDDGGAAGGALGNNITIVVNGGMLGDPSSAREFAMAVDAQLLELRRNNESTSFDSDVI